MLAFCVRILVIVVTSFLNPAEHGVIAKDYITKFYENLVSYLKHIFIYLFINVRQGTRLSLTCCSEQG